MTHRPYDGRIVIVTGGAGGIGAETARTFADLGATIVLVDIAGEKLERAKNGIGSAATVHVVESRLDDYEACRQICERAGSPPHVVVHLAGVSVPDPDDPSDIAVFDEAISANTRNAYLMARAFEQYNDGTAEDPARIILASSLAYRRGGPDRVAYSAAKGAITGMVRALARRNAPRILVNGIAPGVIVTPMAEPIIARRGDALMAEIPLRRYGNVSEVSGVIEFLAGPASTYVNGQIINIDGGTIHS